MSFNVLTDQWIPLQAGDHTRLASYPELLCGEQDAEGLRHTRDDFRVFALMLLSALNQALFPARDLKELQQRLSQPLSRSTVDEVLGGVAGDFDLCGERPFLQDSEAKGEDNDSSALLLDVSRTSGIPLKRPAEPHDGFCLPCAVLALYGAQAFAAAGGRGYSPSVRGSPPATTLVWQPSVRAMVWANTLALTTVEAEYPKEGHCPWRSSKAQKNGGRIGVVEGLFWQPRSVRLAAISDGECCTCGKNGPRLAGFGFSAKSRVEGFFAHPHTPSVVVKGDRRSLHLPTDRPSWTALADMLTVTRSTNAGETDGETLAAPVVVQWIEALRHRDVRLVVFSYETEKGQAKLLGRFSETWTVSMGVRDLDLLSDLRGLVTQAEQVVERLRYALRCAHSDPREKKKDKGGYWLDDAAAAFWQATEPAFWDAKAAFERNDDPSASFAQALRRAAIGLFDRHTEPSCFDNTHQELVARARAGLLHGLAGLLATKEATNERA